MNEIPTSVYNILLILDLIIIAYSLYKINFDKPTTIDKIITSVIAAPLSFILGSYSINGEVIYSSYVTNRTLTSVAFQSLPLYYFLIGFAVLMTILSILLIVKFISDHFESLEKKSSLGDWKQNSFSPRGK